MQNNYSFHAERPWKINENAKAMASKWTQEFSCAGAQKGCEFRGSLAKVARHSLSCSALYAHCRGCKTVIKTEALYTHYLQCAKVPVLAYKTWHPTSKMFDADSEAHYCFAAPELLTELTLTLKG